MPLGSTGNLAAPVEDNMDSIQFFELIHIADLVQQMIDVYYQEDIVSIFNVSVLYGLANNHFKLRKHGLTSPTSSPN